MTKHSKWNLWYQNWFTQEWMEECAACQRDRTQEDRPGQNPQQWGRGPGAPITETQNCWTTCYTRLVGVHAYMGKMSVFITYRFNFLSLEASDNLRLSHLFDVTDEQTNEQTHKCVLAQTTHIPCGTKAAEPHLLPSPRAKNASVAATNIYRKEFILITRIKQAWSKGLYHVIFL